MTVKQLLKIAPVRAFLMDGSIFAVLTAICTKYSVASKRADEFLDLCDAVLNGDLTVEQMPMLIAQAFGVTDDVAKQMAIEIAGVRLLPLADYVPGIEEGILALGGRLEDFPGNRIAKDQSVQLIILADIVSGLQLTLTDVLLKRLLFLAQQFAKKEKNEESLKTFLSRSVNIGGLGLTPEQASALVAAIAAQVETFAPPNLPMSGEGRAAKAKVIEPVAQAPVESSGQTAKTAPKAGTPLFRPEDEPAMIDGAVQITEDRGQKEDRIQKTEALTEKPKIPTPDPSHSLGTGARRPPVDLPDKQSAKKAAAVKKVAASIEDAFVEALVVATENAAPILKKKKISEKVFGDIAGKAIRGLRDVYQTRDLAERDLGLQGADLAAFMEAITGGINAYEESAKGLSLASAESSSTTKGPVATSESAVLDKRFSAITAQSPKEKVEPELPGARVSAARTKDEELALQVGATQADSAAADTPPRAKAQLTVGSVPVQTATGQRKVVDVVSAPRLVGPVQQLGGMTPTEFRRLSSNPAEAGQKIEDLLSALEATSYEERVKGVLAWRESPINQLYLNLAEEALSQKLTLPEVSSRRRAAGKDSLSPAEMAALAKLNSRIRF